MSGYVSENAVIGKNVTIGYHCVIEDNVLIEDDVTIGHNVVIYKNTTIGKGSRIYDNVVIGKRPMRAARSVMRKEDNLSPAKIGQYCTIGTNAIIYVSANLENYVFVADLATIREKVNIGQKTIVGRGVSIENECNIGKCCKIETNAYVTAFSELEDYVFIAPGVITSNDNYAGRTKKRFDKFKGCTVKRGGRIGANATILPGRIIHEDGFVGAGSVVTNDVESEIIVVGNPAKRKKKVDEEHLLKYNMDE